MAQQDTDLPEGTDKVVDGAMNTDNEQVENTGVIATSGGSRKRTGGGGSRKRTGGSDSGGGTGNAIMEKVRSGRKRQALRSRPLTRLAISSARVSIVRPKALANVGKLVGDTAGGLDERLGEEYGNYARRAAETLENTANRLASKDPDELIDDTRDFIRKSPGVALAGAAIVGFALATAGKVWPVGGRRQTITIAARGRRASGADAEAGRPHTACGRAPDRRDRQRSRRGREGLCARRADRRKAIALSKVQALKAPVILLVPRSSSAWRR
jgi:hypothetical protein